MRKKFPNSDWSVIGPLMEEIGTVVEDHLGFRPSQLALIVTDKKQCQTWFAGEEGTPLRAFERLLEQGLENHRKRQGQVIRP